MRSNFRTTLQAAGSSATGDGTVLSIGDDWGASYITIYIVGSAGIASGAVSFETAHAVDYAGTWAPLAVVTAVASSVVTAHAAGNYRFVRARISTTIGSGTVTVLADVSRMA